MSHCYSVGVNVAGEDKEVCLVVPGNEDIKQDVEKGRTPTVTKEHVNRAVDYYLKHQHEEDQRIQQNPSRRSPVRGSILHAD